MIGRFDDQEASILNSCRRRPLGCCPSPHPGTRSSRIRKSDLLPFEITRQQNLNVNVVSGPMTFRNGSEQSRVSSIDECNETIDIFQSHGHNQFDKSRFYKGDTSEAYLPKTSFQDRGLIPATRCYLTVGRNMSKEWTHSYAHLRKHLEASLAAFGTKRSSMWVPAWP